MSVNLVFKKKPAPALADQALAAPNQIANQGSAPLLPLGAMLLAGSRGTSALAQGCTGQLTTVQVARFDGNLPPIQAFDPPGSRTAQAAE